MSEAKRELRAVDVKTSVPIPPSASAAPTGAPPRRRASPYRARARWRRTAFAALALALAAGGIEAVRFLGTHMADGKIAAVVAAPITQSVLANNKCLDKAGKLVGKGPGCDPEAINEAVMAVLNVAYRRQLDIGWATAIIRVESNFNKYAVSPRLALGLGQIHDAAWTQELRRLGIINSSWDLFDPEKNIAAKAHIWGVYLRESGGNIERALCMYNAGYTGNCGDYPAQVERWARSL